VIVSFKSKLLKISDEDVPSTGVPNVEITIGPIEEN
jgi:hypothetical protein